MGELEGYLALIFDTKFFEVIKEGM